MNTERADTQPRQVAVVGRDRVAHQVIDALHAAGRIVVHSVSGADASADPETACGICGQPTEPEKLTEDVNLDMELCPLCRATAERVKKRWKEDARREWQELLAQLPQITRDVRAGRDEPTFYRGFE